MSRPIATVALRDRRQIVLELDADAAPNCVANFISLSSEGFFDDLAFVRAESTLAQIGPPGPVEDWLLSPGYELAAECATGGHDNPLGFLRGAVGMALGSQPQLCSAGVWFIMSQDVPAYDPLMPAFGHVIEGIDIIDEICASPTRPTVGGFAGLDSPVVVSTVRVDTQGRDYPKPKTQPDGSAAIRALFKDPAALEAKLAQMRSGNPATD